MPPPLSLTLSNCYVGNVVRSAAVFVSATGETLLSREAVDAAMLNISSIVFCEFQYSSDGARKACPVVSKLRDVSVLCRGLKGSGGLTCSGCQWRY